MRLHPEDSVRVFEEMPKLFREGEQVVAYRFRHAQDAHGRAARQRKRAGGDDADAKRWGHGQARPAREERSVSARRSASATMVSVGFACPELGNTELLAR